MSGAAQDAERLAEAVEELQLIDHHVHGAFAGELDRETFERSITESDRALPVGTSTFDSQVGFAIRRWCAPALGLEPHASPEAYLDRRRELGPQEVNRRLLGSSGVTRYLVDTGFATTDLLDPTGMAAAAGTDARASEVVRLESLAEEVALQGGGAARFPETFLEALGGRLEAGAVGTKSVVAYRHGFDLDLARPLASAVQQAASRWFADIEWSGRIKLTDPTLLVFLLWAAIDAGRPLQIHVGFGDSDLHLMKANPALLTDFIKEAEPSGTPIMLLHCYPYHREAAYLAHIFPNVFFDIGVIVNYTGAQSKQLVAESLEVGPFTKQLFSSDAWGPAELHHLGARLWRNAFAAVVGAWVADGDWSLDDGVRVASLIGAENAERTYRL
jgi:predicted TIM-barrel fold metal-dependent hydrolase